MDLQAQSAFRRLAGFSFAIHDILATKLLGLAETHAGIVLRPAAFNVQQDADKDLGKQPADFPGYPRVCDIENQNKEGTNIAYSSF